MLAYTLRHSHATFSYNSLYFMVIQKQKRLSYYRITLTSPSSTQIHKMAAFADKHSTVVNETKKAFRPTVNEPISNGDVSYA